MRCHREFLPWAGGTLAVLMAVVPVTGYMTYRHLNGNIAWYLTPSTAVCSR